MNAFHDEKPLEMQSLDDFPVLARLSARQRFLAIWSRPMAIVPFLILMALDYWVFPDSHKQLLFWLMVIALIWSFNVLAYSVYLRMKIKCPRCGGRYGAGDACPHCRLRRHAIP